MSVYDTILKRRTIRKFKKKRIDFKILEKCVNAARLSPSAANLQPLEFIVVDDKKLLEKVFSCLSWAGYLEWSPTKEEMPRAYIVILINKKKRTEGGEYDVGIAAEAMSLVAEEEGLGSCIIGSIDTEKLEKILDVPDYCEIKLVLAIGYPDEKSVAEKMKNDVKYWRDENGVMHVPKRSLRDILHRNKYQ